MAKAREQASAATQPESIRFAFGPMAKPIATQLVEQGIEYIAWLVSDEWQSDADAIARLHVRGLMTDREARIVRKRLMNSITNNMRQLCGA